MRLGKGKHAIGLAVFLLWHASSFGQAVTNFRYQLDGKVQRCDVIAGNLSFVLDYSITELDIENITNDNGTFYRISIPGHVPTTIPGEPELPVFSRLISLPEGSEYKVKISEVRSTRITPGTKKIRGILYPVQEGETKQAQEKKPVYHIDKTVYAATRIISSDTVRVEPLGTLRNKKLANIYISPVRYNPHSNALEVIYAMKIEITYSDAGKSAVKSLSTESALFNETLSKGILDYNPGNVVPGYSSQPVKMVILTDTAFKKQLEPFLKWKTQKGFKLNVLYRGAGFAGNTYTQIKETLTNIYRSSTAGDPPPDYLLIIGDVNRVPVYGTGSAGNVTDMYYGEFDGNGDYIPDMYIGRLPVADTAELKNVVNKILQYEKFQFADTNRFYSNALLTAGYDDSYGNYMNGQLDYAAGNYLTPANKIEQQHFNYYYIKEKKDKDALLGMRKDSIIKLINKGTSFINYTGHGIATGWQHINIDTSTVRTFTNKNMYPFVISNACRTSQFNTVSSFGNSMVLSVDKGAIGFIGCSNDSYWDEDFYWAVGAGTPSANPTYLNKGLGAYDRLFHSHNESPSEWYYTMGQINYAGNLAVSSSTSSNKKYYWETYNLVGDPSVIPIMGKPDPFKISLPDTLPNGIKTLTINADPFSYVAVSHFDTLWDASFVSPSGSAMLKMPGLSDDSCLIVVTARNKIPFIKKLYISALKDEFINLTATSINDSTGNNNKMADYGESFYLKLTIANLGLTDTKNLQAKISSSSDWVTIDKDSVLIGTLSARSEIVLSDDLGIKISGSIPDMQMVTINLVLKDLKTEKHFTIDIAVHAPKLQIISCIMDDSVLGNGNHIADPGETFTLIFKVRNQGSSNISGQFDIISSENEITILEPSVKSGVLKFGEITDIPITVKLSESSMSGSYFSISSTLDCSPLLVNKEFTFRVGRIRESFEAESFNIFPWINLSAIPWILTKASSFDGGISARSGLISHNGTTSLIMRTVYAVADSLKFFYKVSSEAGYDYFSFKLNDTEIFKKSGEVSWTRKVVAVPAGLNKMEWIYKKDNSVSVGSDCAWIDMIDFAISGSVSYIQKDLQVAKIVTPFQTDRYGQETVSVKVLNVGRDTINGFNMAYTLNGHLPVQQFFENKLIPYGDSVSVTFKTQADLSKYGIYKIASYAYDNNDNYFLNDTARISIENTDINESLSIFPNPFTDHFTVFIDSRVAENIQISISNIAGTKFYIYEKNILSGRNDINISDIRLSPSIYYVNIRGATFNKTLTVLKVTR
jgi:hypothetical protein